MGFLSLDPLSRASGYYRVSCRSIARCGGRWTGSSTRSTFISQLHSFDLHFVTELGEGLTWPGGPVDISPAIYRWAACRNLPSPGGTTVLDQEELEALCGNLRRSCLPPVRIRTHSSHNRSERPQPGSQLLPNCLNNKTTKHGRRKPKCTLPHRNRTHLVSVPDSRGRSRWEHSFRISVMPCARCGSRRALQQSQ